VTVKITRGRVIGAGIAVALVAAIAYSMRPKPLVVDTATVRHQPLETTIDADGRTRVRERYAVVAPVSGRLERIHYLEGALVRAGDIVARLAPVPLDSQTFIQSRARVAAAEALALAATGQARIAAAALEQRRRELSRATRLAEVGGVAPRVVEECQLALTEAEEAARGAAERQRAAEADRDQARALLIGPSAAVLVRAPAAGRVLRIAERSERIVVAGSPLLDVGDPSSLEVVVDVLSSDAAAVRPGDVVRLAEWGGSGDEPAQAIDGHVREIEPAGFTRVSALGVDEQRVNVIVDLDRAPSAIGDGFRVEASIIVWSSPSVLAVPRGALLQVDGEGAGGWSVFVISRGRAERRSLRVGHLAGATAEVLAGLAAGEEVVLFPSDRLTPGARVKSRKS
jgi:HlyD family secretion protein